MLRLRDANKEFALDTLGSCLAHVFAGRSLFGLL